MYGHLDKLFKFNEAQSIKLSLRNAVSSKRKMLEFLGSYIRRKPEAEVIGSGLRGIWPKCDESGQAIEIDVEKGSIISSQSY